MRLLPLILLAAAALLPAHAAQSPPAVIVTLGDSITRGVRPGVTPDQTFSALLQARLRDRGRSVEVVNAGIGGERTDQALLRLERDVLARRPRLVTVMYGTNDSYVDRGTDRSRLTVEEYRRNLETLVDRLRAGGAEPVLMTEPRWADAASPNGVGEHPNVRLEPFVRACREVARRTRTPLVDHYAGWTRARKAGTDLMAWTTDACHPNPAGHAEMADRMLPVLEKALRRAPREALDYQVRLETVLKHDDGKFLWYHPRAASIPGGPGAPRVVMTLQKHLHTSDHYSGLSVLRTADLGRTWSGPEARPELDWEPGGPGVDVGVCDVTPGWHPRTRRVLAVGAQVRYSARGEQLEDTPRASWTAYSVLDPRGTAWTRWRRVELPAGELFNYARSACSQWLSRPDGRVLLPFYIGRNDRGPWEVTVVEFAFDGETLTYLRHGDVLKLPVDRGLVEPSLAEFQGRYYLTLRNDRKGYVARGADGLHWEPMREWTFDDGAELGSYNTQQHWVTHRDGLFLVYTRRGANNDHIIRHRAPLFMARVDPERLVVLRHTERVLIPERGGEYGNFGAVRISDREAWVTVGEGVWSDDARRRGAEGAVFVARILWSKPDRGPDTR